VTPLAVADTPVLTVEDVVTHFPTAQGFVRAVDGVSLSVRAGRTLGVVGESGSGKSMLARSIMGLTPPNAMTPSGRVCLDGVDLRDLPPRELRARWGAEIAMVFQDPMTALNPVVRIGRQITESLRAHGLRDRDAARHRAVELLTNVGIPNPAERLASYPHELSGGMRQRVGIAIALACEPRILIADEPTTALDVTVQRQILDLLSGIQEASGMAMILITHDLGVVAGRADEVAVMYGGRVVERAATTTLFGDMRHPYTAALLTSIPRVDKEPHTRIPVIAGRPAPVIDPVGCRFAPRCPRAQPDCLVNDPPLTPLDGEDRAYACHYPVGTPDGDEALERNLATGTTAAGLSVAPNGATEGLVPDVVSDVVEEHS
jgi:peptide/nickel transport system ATP-binding protein